MYSFNRLFKTKKRHFLILFASNIYSGLECLYLEVDNTQWHIVYNRSIHYPQNIKDLAFKILYNPEQKISLEDYAKLDCAMTVFFKESANQILSHVSKGKRSIDLVIFNNFTAWRGFINEKQKPHYWNIHFGDAQLLANYLQTPVLSQFIRQDILYNGSGNLAISYGDLLIGKLTGEIAVLINLGLSSHMTVIDTNQAKILIESDTGPGTYLIDLAAQHAGCTHGFDRDGATASSGAVNTKALESLLSDDWFKQAAPKQADTALFKKLYTDHFLNELSPIDKVSTLTAFTALSICNFYKREYAFEKKPDAIWLSGGGTNNLALIDFLKAYFAPLPVKTIDQVGIPNTSRIPLSMGLTVQAYLNHQGTSGNTIAPPDHLGKWVIPC